MGNRKNPAKRELKMNLGEVIVFRFMSFGGFRLISISKAGRQPCDLLIYAYNMSNARQRIKVAPGAGVDPDSISLP
jgi:hypothetical protein